MGIQDRDYYREREEKVKTREGKEILIWIIIIIVILSLILSSLWIT